MTPTGRAWLAAAVLMHVVVAVGYLRVVPCFNWPDEPAHFNYVRDLTEGRSLPVMAPEAWAPEALERLKASHFTDLGDPLASADLAAIRYQAHQPPLYYLAAAAVFRLWPSPNGLKLFNLALSCLALLVAVLVARRLVPGEPWVQAGAAALLALLPMRAFMAVSIGNDVAAELLFAVFALAVVSGWTPGRIGLIVGAGVLTKASLVLALPLYGLWLAGRRTTVDGAGPVWRTLWWPCLQAGAVALAVASPWLVRNGLIYGWADPLALSAGAWGWQGQADIARPGLTLVGDTGVAAFLANLFQSWWGVFGWMEMYPEPLVLTVYLLLTALVLAGWIRLAVRRKLRWSDGWLAAAPALLAVALVVYSFNDYQPQGRYLLLTAAVSGLLFGRGLTGLFGGRASWAVAGVALILLTVHLHTVRSVIPWYLGPW